MSYNLVYTRTSVNDIKKLDRIVKKRIKKKLEYFSNDPLKYARSLTDKKLGDYRWQVGNYRIAFDLKGKEIVILRIRHRKEVYR